MSVPMPQGSAGDHFLARDGATLRYRDEGRGPAVVLIHGWLLDLTIWDSAAVALRRAYRVIRMDRRSFGASTGTPDLRADADDLVCLLDELEIARTAVVAMSQGTRVGLRLAARAPDRVACLVLDGTPVLGGLGGGPWREETPFDEYRKLMHSHGVAAVREALARHPLLRLVTEDPRARQSLRRMLERYDGADLQRPRASDDGVSASDLPRLPMPTLILNGELDAPQRLRVGDELARAIPHAERRVLPRAGHLACIDRPDAYAACLTEFLTTYFDRSA